MTLEFKHFDTRLNQWIYLDANNKNPESILAEKLDNTLLESYFPEKFFSFGHIDEYSKSEDLKNHPDGHVLLLSSKTRLLYGPPECLEVIEKLCPDRKDRGAYGSIFLGSCRDAISEKLNILVVDDSSDAKGKNARKENANPQARAKKVSNFAFAAFPNEIISRLDKLQFTEPKLVTLLNEANQFLGRDWNKDDLHPIEIRASHHPVGHERYVSRLMFVQDTDGEYKEFAMLETRTAQLPIGTKALSCMVGVEPATAKATIGLPGNEPIEITIRELKNFSYAGLVFNAEPVNLEFGTVPVTDKTVKIKLDGKTLGELDSDSTQQLKEINYLKNGNPLKLKLTSISETGDQAFVLGESGNGNLLKINKINFYDFSGQTFNDQDYRKLTIETPPLKTRDAVFLNGEPLGVLHFKKDKDALRQLGLLKTGQLTHADAIIQSNFSVICAQIDPNTVEYPQKWTKEFQVFGTQSVNCHQQEMIDSSAKILHHIKERPTFLFSTESNKGLGVMGLAVDNHKVESVTLWLKKQNVVYSKVLPEDVIRETKKGLAVFNLVDSSIPAKTLSSMTKKFGAIIESNSDYQQRVNSLATRPQFLKPPSQSALSPPQQSAQFHPNQEVQNVAPESIKGKPIPMNYPLMMHGDTNPLPVDTVLQYLAC